MNCLYNPSIYLWSHILEEVTNMIMWIRLYSGYKYGSISYCQHSQQCMPKGLLSFVRVYIGIVPCTATCGDIHVWNWHTKWYQVKHFWMLSWFAHKATLRYYAIEHDVPTGQLAICRYSWPGTHAVVHLFITPIETICSKAHASLSGNTITVSIYLSIYVYINV